MEKELSLFNQKLCRFKVFLYIIIVDGIFHCNSDKEEGGEEGRKMSRQKCGKIEKLGHLKMGQFRWHNGRILIFIPTPEYSSFQLPTSLKNPGGLPPLKILWCLKEAILMSSFQSLTFQPHSGREYAKEEESISPVGRLPLLKYYGASKRRSLTFQVHPRKRVCKERRKVLLSFLFR